MHAGTSQPSSGNTSVVHVTCTYITFSTHKPPNAMSTHILQFSNLSVKQCTSILYMLYTVRNIGMTYWESAQPESLAVSQDGCSSTQL
jgi:hypothetical protein